MSVTPSGSSELFATSSVNDVRVWHAATGKELLRLSLPKLTCNAVVIRPDGKAIITGGCGPWEGGGVVSSHHKQLTGLLVVLLRME